MSFTEGGEFGGGRVQTRTGRGNGRGRSQGQVVSTGSTTGNGSTSGDGRVVSTGSTGGGMVSTGSTGGGMVSTGSDSGGGLGRGPLIGGGIGVTLIVALIGYFLGGRGEGGGDIVSQVLEPVLTSSNVIQSGGEDTGFVGVCTAAQANSDANCQLSATADSLDTFWGATLPAEVGIRYEQPDIVSFDGTTRTACGTANTSAGPFYCPGDKAIYIDTAFYQDLVSQFGGSEGPLAREYILAHEFGHAIQHQLGVLDHDHSVTGAESASVRTELQADCFAGIWAKAASSTVDPDTGVVFLNPLSEQDVSDAISAASSVGDDHIQQMSRGTVDPDSFTHGSSAQRVAWFMQGYQHGTVASCDTFAASNLG